MEISPDSGLAADDRAAAGHPQVQELFDRADGLLAQGRVDEALWVLLDATEAAPELWLTHYRYAELLLVVGDARVRDALPAAEAARELRPTLPSTHTLHGLSLEARGDRAGARSGYLRALELDPDHVGALNNLAALDLGGWRLARASSRLARALETDPTSRATRVNLALVATRMGLRLLALLVGCAIVLAVLIGLDVSRGARALTCAGLVGLVAVLAIASWRTLPTGSRADSVRAVPAIPRWGLAGALAVATGTVVAMGVTSRGLAANVGAGTFALVLSLTLLGVVALWLIGRRGTGRGRRH